MSRRTSTTLMALLVSLLLVGLTGGTASANPETAHRKPNQDAGHFLGHPTPTYQWHGCTQTSTRKTPTTAPAAMPRVPKGTKQKKVTWTLVESAAADSGWVLRWEAAKGWKVCGVQASVLGHHPAVTTYLIMQTGYTSGAQKGSTVRSGAETVKVAISRREAQMGGLAAQYGGKKYTIEDIYALAVFVKKAK
jgi:hypothetical protein